MNARDIHPDTWIVVCLCNQLVLQHSLPFWKLHSKTRYWSRPAGIRRELLVKSSHRTSHFHPAAARTERASLTQPGRWRCAGAQRRGRSVANAESSYGPSPSPTRPGVRGSEDAAAARFSWRRWASDPGHPSYGSRPTGRPSTTVTAGGWRTAVTGGHGPKRRENVNGPN
jgi:hypothetical protein